jgi:tRNA (guanine37-N1)-methyltransferase
VCGKRKYAVQYRENGCVFSFDPRKAFFSSRLSFERSRILNASKDNEKTMVMFAGIGPFAIEIGKKNKNSEIVAIEINPYACSSMRKNIRINKIHNVKVDCGDVKKLAKKYPDFADRIIMPLPWSSLEFLDDALRVSKKKATVHLYVFGNKEELPDSAWGMIKEHAKKNDYKASMLFSRAVRTYSASEIEMVIDYAIKKK